jgi:hypothetical protein
MCDFMGKRKQKYKYLGQGYPDYELLFDGITSELEKLYQHLWDKRKESPMLRSMGKQVKTAWMLWKLGTEDVFRGETLMHYTNQHDFEYRQHKEIYVNSGNEYRFRDSLYRHHPQYNEGDDSFYNNTLDEWLQDIRRAKASKLMMPYLSRTLMNWRDGSTLYYNGILTAMNTQLIEIRDFLKYGKTWADHRETLRDLEDAISLLADVQSHIDKPDERDAWDALFSLIERKYRWWYD